MLRLFRIFTLLFVCSCAPDKFIRESYGLRKEEAKDRLWYLQNGRNRLNVSLAWQNFNQSGKGITVGVVDAGIDFTNIDLTEAVNTNLSFNALDNTTNQMPYICEESESYGTNFAGVIAARDKSCTKGIAYGSTLVGIKIFNASHPPTSQTIAQGFQVTSDYVDIYFNNWRVRQESDKLYPVPAQVSRAINDTITRGRDGRGSILVFSVGNGGMLTNCAYDGYIQDIRVIGISTLDSAGRRVPLSERCSAVVAAASGATHHPHARLRGLPITTTTFGKKGCAEDKFHHKSAAAAMASGVIALVLERNNQLTWREVQHLIACTATPLNDNEQITNAADVTVSTAFGFGLLNADKMLNYSRNFRIPESKTYEVVKRDLNRVLPGKEYVKVESRGILAMTEWVEVSIRMKLRLRGFFNVTLKSPEGSRSVVFAGSRGGDQSSGEFNWTVKTIAFWREDPNGLWTLSVEKPQMYFLVGKLFEFKLLIHGTAEKYDCLQGHRTTSTTTSKTETTTQTTTTTVATTSTTEPTTITKMPTTSTTQSTTTESPTTITTLATTTTAITTTKRQYKTLFISDIPHSSEPSAKPLHKSTTKSSKQNRKSFSEEKLVVNIPGTGKSSDVINLSIMPWWTLILLMIITSAVCAFVLACIWSRIPSTPSSDLSRKWDSIPLQYESGAL